MLKYEVGVSKLLTATVIAYALDSDCSLIKPRNSMHTIIIITLDKRNVC